MKLSERLQKEALSDRRGVIGGKEGAGGGRAYNDIKSRVHFRLLERLDLSAITGMPREALAGTIKEALEEITEVEKVPLNQRERSALVRDLMDEILGLGPIEPLMQDDSIQDILANGASKVYVERGGVLRPTGIQFRDNDHLMQIIDKIVSAVGRRVDESSPMVDARLPDGSRVNVIVPPLALDGPILSIRKFGRNPIAMADLLAGGSITEEIVEYLSAAVRSRLNIMISGGTGSGKTTLLNALSAFIPETERIVTIEDSAELDLHQPHVVRLESRPPNIEGRGAVSLTDLMKNSLRMRPDRIIVGETRGAEVMDMLQAMNTGHPGSMSTIHTNSPRDALARMEVMLSMGTAMFSERAMRALIASAIDIIVHLARLPDGKRRAISVSEIVGLENDTVQIQDIFRFEQHGVNAEGGIFGAFCGAGVRSKFLDHIRVHGIELAPEIFDFCREVDSP
jgi:pilus assembly protein CpaF